VKNKGMKSLTENFSRWQLAVIFAIVVALTDPLRDRVLSMIGIEAAGIARILARAVVAGVIGGAAAFVMLRLTPKRDVEPPPKN
jgi:hypothetical protein